MKIVLWILGILIGLLLLFCLTFSVAALLVDKNKVYDKQSKFYRWLINGCDFFVMLYAGVKLTVTGLEKVPRDQRFLLVSNHRSAYDPLITFYALRKIQDVSFISKPENFNLFIFGRLIRRCCFVPIDRDDPKEAMRNLLKAAEYIKDDQVSMGVYPEGTRSHDKGVGEFHNGVIKVAQKAKVPMVVCSISGTETISERAPWRRSKVRLNIIKVVPVEEIMSKRTIVLGEEAKATIVKDLEENE